jgi:hypothetical protein
MAPVPGSTGITITERAAKSSVSRQTSERLVLLLPGALRNQVLVASTMVPMPGSTGTTLLLLPRAL